jgi:hypothetical protein
MTTTKRETWHQRPRSSRLANVLYPSHADAAVRQEMSMLAGNERKKPPQGPKLLGDRERGACSQLGGQATGGLFHPLAGLGRAATRKGK